MSDADKKWIPGSDDQFYYWDWCIRHGIEPDVSYRVHTTTRSATLTHEFRCSAAPTGASHHRVPLINGMGPFDANLHALVAQLKVTT